ncbi:N-succinyldiaminopimelate aminotransferase [Actinacidiphila bryophytorum]|uniref:N-succinyldiaminopimelate aminotransferase n=1 Tax=Actinacidiphila bryophytorum TaxID=1436133 RepID=A0A9W4H432_9ACTN|nr:N-succinyldiaminopimelate aminotransferase [Actinacidiphila bryophytorum]
MTGSRELVAAVRTTKQFLTYVASGPCQYAVAEALALPDTYYTGIRDDLMAKRDILAEGLRDAGFTVHEPQGTYFTTTDIARLAPGEDALAFCRTLPERAGVVAAPNSAFYDHPTAGRTQVRFAFCKREDVLTDAAQRLRKAFDS